MQDLDPIAQTIAARLTALQAGGRLSAWSLIVSFLGDAIGPRGGVVSASTVQSVMGRLGIGHGAVRTAISRLSADGWIERTREGRNGFYRLSADVAGTVLSAERRIYAASSLLPVETPRSLIIAASPLPDSVLPELESAGALRLAPELVLCFGGAGNLPALLRPPAATVAGLQALHPGAALRAQLAEARHFGEVDGLLTAYLPVRLALDQHPAPAPAQEDAMALRCLMIHEWRRIALRVLPIPADLLQQDDPEPATRALIAALYRRLLVPSEAWLDQNATTPSGPLPPPGPRLGQRFGGGNA